MQSPSSGDDRNPRSSRPRGGNRQRSRNGRQGGGERAPRRKTDGPDEFRPSDKASRQPRRESRKTPPKPTFLQKLVKLFTLGLVDPAAKKPGAAPRKPAPSPDSFREKAAAASKGGEGRKRERRAPELIEPTGPRLYVGNLSFDVTDDDLATLFATHGSVVLAEVVRRSGSSQSKGFAFVEMGSVEEAKAAAAALNDHELQGRKMLVTGAKTEGKAEGGERSERGERRGRRERSERSEGEDLSPEGEGGRYARGSGRERSPRSGGRGERGERGGRGRRGDSDEIDKPTRQVRPLVIETVSSPSLRVENVNADAGETDLADLFSGIGTIASREETGPGKDDRTKNLLVELADTAEAQKAVELLDGKCFMGHELRVTGTKSGASAQAPAAAPVEAPVETVADVSAETAPGTTAEAPVEAAAEPKAEA